MIQRKFICAGIALYLTANFCGCTEISDDVYFDDSIVTTQTEATDTTVETTAATTTVTTETAQESLLDRVVYFRQDDPAWGSNTLGYSQYTMADSGCVTCCVAVVLQMQEIAVDGLSTMADAGEVNQFLTENGGYDSEGNILWDTLEEVTGMTVVREDATEVEDGELEALLEEGICPILRVKLSTMTHYVVLV